MVISWSLYCLHGYVTELILKQVKAVYRSWITHVSCQLLMGSFVPARVAAPGPPGRDATHCSSLYRPAWQHLVHRDVMLHTARLPGVLYVIPLSARDEHACLAVCLLAIYMLIDDVSVRE